MPASDYFKVAAANIRRAVDLKRAEINELHALMETKKKETVQYVQQKESEVNNKQSDIAATQNNQDEPDKDRATKLKEIAFIKNEIAKKQQELNREQGQILNQIRDLERDLSSTEQLASSLETKS